ncbi:MAG: hypothetical protein VW333_13815, partial [Pseudomonadales bacterium]
PEKKDPPESSASPEKVEATGETDKAATISPSGTAKSEDAQPSASNEKQPEADSSQTDDKPPVSENKPASDAAPSSDDK